MMASADFLCVFGANGAGKTRLLQSIEQYLAEGNASRVGTETLVDELVQSFWHYRGIAKWRQRHTAVDTLLLDNLWVLASRPSAAEVICQMIRDRRDSGKLTAVASDLPLSEWMEKNPAIARLLTEGTTIRLT